MNSSSNLDALWFRCLSNAIALAMGCWRADGGLFNPNDTLLRLIGYSREEVELGQVRWTDLTPREFAALDEHALNEVRAKGSCAPFEKEYIRKDGRRVPVLVGGAAFGGGITDAGVFFAVELTERKGGECHQGSEALPELLSLTERQRLICLLLSHGETEKRIAGLLKLGLRTVESDKHLAAKHLDLPISRVVIWAVENRHALLTAIRNGSRVSDPIAEIIGRVRP